MVGKQAISWTHGYGDWNAVAAAVEALIAAAVDVEINN